MLDFIKVTWTSWNETPYNFRTLVDNQEKIFRSEEEANAFIETLNTQEGVIKFHKITHEFFRITP